MNFTAEDIAKQIFIQLLPYTITDVTTCMTRLRLSLEDKGQLNIELLKAIPGVLWVVDTPEQLQIIIGPGKVNQVYEHFMVLLDRNKADILPEKMPKTILEKQIKQRNATPFKLFLKKIANIFIPIIPAFIACGLVIGILNVITKYQLIDNLTVIPFDRTQFGSILKLIGSGLSFVLAILVGVNAAKEFNGTPALGGILAAVLTMPELAHIEVFGIMAIPGRGGIIAVLLVTIFAAYLERFLRIIIPNALDLFLTPLLVLIISSFLAIFLLQPIGGLISDMIVKGSLSAVNYGGPMIGFILSALFLPLVMTGLHQGLIPIHAELIKTAGSTVLLPILAMAGAGQVGASLAVLIKTHNAKLKHIIKSSIIVGFLGIGEPLIYGVTLPLFRPFIAACIGGGLGGAFVAYFKLGATGIGLSGLPLTLLIQNGMLLYLSGIFIAYFSGFTATLIFGFDESIYE